MLLPVNLEGDSFKVTLFSFKAPVMGQKPSNKTTKVYVSSYVLSTYRSKVLINVLYAKGRKNIKCAHIIRY